jgi:SAM-dependent methyltransferase
MDQILRAVAHIVFRLRTFNIRRIKAFAKRNTGKRILELGSGEKRGGEYVYSSKTYFDASNDFVQSDVVEGFGHRVVDATTMGFDAEFDVVLCMNTLEHIYDFQKAIANIRRALKPGGTAVITLPAFYPLHDEPNDYWRFTEHSLRILFKDFSRLEIKHSGPRRYPFGYYIEAVK